MQNPNDLVPRRERRRPQISCTECRRRKQKCNKRKDAPCSNCSRRYPPVDCFVKELEESRLGNKQRRDIDEEDEDEEIPATDSRNDIPDEKIPLGFPLIPLSRILHPVDDTRSSHRIDRSPDPFISWCVDDAEPKNTSKPVHWKLKIMGPGVKEAMQKQSNASESPRPFGGILSMLNSFNDMPVNTTLRNAELFHFFHDYVVPRICTIDGGTIPHFYATEILPWQMKSPLMPNIAILMAAATQSNLREFDTEGVSETLVIKAHVLKLVNRFIRQDFFLVGNQAIRIVIHLVVIEFFWGSIESMWAHMEGIRQMLSLHGGLSGMNDPMNMHVLIVTDYELACAFETNLIFQSTETALTTHLPLLESYEEKHRCPLIDYPVTFKDCRKALNLSISGAEILDDVRFLTMSITSCFLFPEEEPIKTSKIQSTASWLYKRLESLPELNITQETDIDEVIFDTIRIIALVYTSAIETLTPLSLSFPASLKERFYSNFALVGLENWKAIPGIFLWILLVATPSTGGDYRGRFLRKQMACTGMCLSFDDFFRGTAHFRAFWIVQRWIDREGLGVDGV